MQKSVIPLSQFQENKGTAEETVLYLMATITSKKAKAKQQELYDRARNAQKIPRKMAICTCHPS